MVLCLVLMPQTTEDYSAQKLAKYLSAAWSGDNLVVANTAGGKVALSGYAAASNKGFCLML